MTTAQNKKEFKKPFWERAITLQALIDIFTMLYITSIYIMSYNTSLNVFSKGLAFVLMALLGVYMLVHKNIKLGALFWSFGTFLFVCLLSCLWGVDVSASASKTFTVLQIFILTILLYNYVKKENKLDYLITVLCLAATIFSVYTVLYFGVEEYFNGLEEGTRMGAEITNVNTIGMSAAAAMAIALWKAVYEKRRIYWISVVICTIVAFGSGSRKALIFVVLSVMLLFVLKGNSRKKIISLFQAVLILAVIYAVLQLPAFSTVGNRINSMLNFFAEEGYVDSSTKYRMSMIEAGWDQFLQTPLTGVGIGNSGYITLPLIGSSTYLHNNYIELLASVGLFGTVSYYLMYLIPMPSITRSAFKQNKYGILGLTLMIIQLVMHVGAVQYYGKTAYIYILVFFLISESEKEGKRNVRKN